MKIISSLIVGFLLGVLSNRMYEQISNKPEIMYEQITYFLLVIATSVAIIWMIRMEKKSELTTYFHLFKMQHSGKTSALSFGNKVSFTNEAPKYFEFINDHFTKEELKKLNKWKRISDEDYILINSITPSKTTKEVLDEAYNSIKDLPIKVEDSQTSPLSVLYQNLKKPS